VASRVDRLRAIGNGQVPAVVRLAWNILNQK
jgi:DNA (cytosine-5)-methyltransferase 1